MSRVDATQLAGLSIALLMSPACKDSPVTESGGCETVWYRDFDSDGFGDDGASLVSCEYPAGYAYIGGDCDDGDPSISPLGPEICDEGDVDEDCDGLVDDEDPDTEGVPQWYADGDGDGLGVGEAELSSCDPQEGLADNDADCDDEDPDVGTNRWFTDLDGDGYGTTNGELLSCEQPEGTSAVDGDCDDGKVDVYPGAPEICGDGALNDCDGEVAQALAGCDYEGEVLLEEEAMSWTGEGGAGAALALAGDLDEDLLSDLLVGAPGASTISLLLSDGSMEGLFEGALVFEGEPGSRFGEALLVAPDLDGDGHAELLVGAPADATGGGDAGAVLLLAGAGGPEPPSSSLTRFVGAEGDQLGGAMVELDAEGGWAFGAPGAAGGLGGARLGDRTSEEEVDLSDDGGLIEGVLEAGGVGEVLAAGDLDGDGINDLALGAPGSSRTAEGGGAVHLFYGPAPQRATVDDADAFLQPLGGGEALGSALAISADMDGDGRPELVVGAPGRGSLGQGSVLLFGAPLDGEVSPYGFAARLDGRSSGGGLGAAVAAIGEPLPRVLALAPAEGRIHVFTGQLFGTLTTNDARSQIVHEDLGGAVIAAPDSSGDFQPDLVFGAPLLDDGEGGVLLLPSIGI